MPGGFHYRYLEMLRRRVWSTLLFILFFLTPRGKLSVLATTDLHGNIFRRLFGQPAIAARSPLIGRALQSNTLLMIARHHSGLRSIPTRHRTHQPSATFPETPCDPMIAVIGYIAMVPGTLLTTG
jgi:hypothetical protein